MSKLLALAVIITGLCSAQSGPTITTATTVVATVGTLTCTGTPLTDSNGVNTFHMSCSVGGSTLADATTTVPSTPGSSFTMNVSSGSNNIAWMLTKGNPTPDGWQVTVTDGTSTVYKQGTF
jgi:hypothetical protein